MPFLVLGVILLINVLFAIWQTIWSWRRPHPHHAGHLWGIVVSVAILGTLALVRRYALLVQDRVIRLEERVRYARLLGPELQAHAEGLTLQQVIALRFASDAELPRLLARAAVDRMEPKAIKQAVEVWRRDELRV